MTIRNLLETLEANQLVKIVNHEGLMLTRSDTLATMAFGSFVIDRITFEHVTETNTVIILATLKTQYITE